MSQAKLEQFQKADWERQQAMLDDAETAAAVERWLGPAAFAELVRYREGTHLAAGAKNVIVVPGVMGSALQSAGHGGVWWLDLMFARDKLNDLALAPDGTSDINPEFEIEPCAIDVSYAPFRHAIAQSGEFGGSVQFAYDWRKPLALSARRLSDLVAKIANDYGEPVHLVGHSMGGLMIRTALMLHGDSMWQRVGKVVFIATPHYGSPSIAGYLKNHLWGWEQIAVLGAFLSRETFRSLWGVLSLLPAPSGVYPGTRNHEAHPCASFDFYDAGAWRLDLDAAATIQLQQALDAARNFHQDLYRWHSTQLSPAERRRMLQISGVGYKTLFRLETRPGWLGLWEDIDKVTARVRGDVNRDGDGRVPVASAALEAVEHRYVKGPHGSLHNIPSVAADVIAWLVDRPLSLSDTMEGALDTHLAAVAASPARNLDGSADVSPHDDEYDRYRDIQPDRLNALLADLDAGRLPNINQVRIL